MLVTGKLTVYVDGIPFQGEILYIRMLVPAPGVSIASYDQNQTAISDINGIVLFPGMVVGAQYAIWGGNYNRVLHIVDVSGYEEPEEDMEYDLPSLLFKTVTNQCGCVENS